MSRSDTDSASTAIASEAAVMSKPVCRGTPSALGAEADHDVPQRPVVDVQHPAPGDVVQVEAERVALVQVVVEHRGEHVVRGRDGVHVTGQVQVQRLERDHLAVAAAGRAALDPEGRAHRGLPDGDRRALADVVHGLAEPDGGGGLPLTERSGRDRRDDHVFGLRAVGQRSYRGQVDLGYVLAVRLEQPGGMPISAPISAIGLSVACRAISSAVGIAMSVFATFSALSGVVAISGPGRPRSWAR